MESTLRVLAFSFSRISTYDLCQGTMAFLPTTRQRYNQCSKYRLNQTLLANRAKTHPAQNIILLCWLTSHVIFLPSQHNLRSTVVSRRHITGHLRILNSSQPEITNLQVAVLVDQDIGWFLRNADNVKYCETINYKTLRNISYQVSMDNSCWVHVFESSLLSSGGLKCWILCGDHHEDASNWLLTKIWYKKYWMNCFSKGREVIKRWRSVPSNSVTK